MTLQLESETVYFKMAFLLRAALLLHPLLTMGSPLTERACSTISGVTHTFYGYPDNDPPGPATAYNCGGRNFVAGGTKPDALSVEKQLTSLKVPVPTATP